MTVLTKHRFNTSEYYRMAETGVIKADARVELLDGGIIDMSPMQERILEVYCEPHLTGYLSVKRFGAGDKVSPRAFPDVMVDITHLLRA